MEELPSFGCRWCCKAALCVFFYPLPLFVAFTPEYILPSCMTDRRRQTENRGPVEDFPNSCLLKQARGPRPLLLGFWGAGPITVYM